MASITASEAETLDPIISRQSEIVAKRYDGVEAEDLAQEVWVWVVEEASPALLGYLADGHLGRLTKSVYNAAVKWCERDRKRRLKEAGIDWRDEYNYTRPEVAKLLPLALDPATIPGLCGGDLHDGPASKSDPAYGGGMLAGIVDVRAAFSRLSGPDQDFVQIVVGLDSNWNDIAATTGLRAQSAYAKWMRILDRMVTRHLGRKTDDDDE